MLKRSRSFALAAAIVLAAMGPIPVAQSQGMAPADLPEWKQARDARTQPVNIYAHTGAGQLSPAVAGALDRIYVPNINSRDVYVIDPATLTVVDHYGVGRGPQHVVPSWDLKTLWVTGSAESHTILGSLTAIDPRTGKMARMLPIEDAYNMYFTPDGTSAIVVAESRRRLEYRDPQTMKLQAAVSIPDCVGVNHADFASDGATAVFTCEFSGSLARIDVAGHKLLGMLKLARGGMPQDVRLSPDGRVYYVANMMTDGVSLIDAESFTEIGFIPTGVGTHGLYPSRDGTKLYVSNRGSHAARRRSARPGKRVRHRLRHADRGEDLADPGRGQSRHGQCQRRRQTALAVGPLRQRRLCDRHDDRRGDQNSRRADAAWPDDLAAARPVLARPHRRHAIDARNRGRRRGGPDPGRKTTNCRPIPPLPSLAANGMMASRADSRREQVWTGTPLPRDALPKDRVRLHHARSDPVLGRLS